MNSARRYTYREFPNLAQAPYHYQDYSTSNQKIGSSIRCNSEQLFPRENEYPGWGTDRGPGVHFPIHRGAGESLRAGTFFQEYGVKQHRTEPGYRDCMGISGLTEEMSKYGFDQRVHPRKMLRALSARSSESTPRFSKFRQADMDDYRFMLPLNYRSSHKIEFIDPNIVPNSARTLKQPAGKSQGKHAGVAQFTHPSLGTW